MTADRGDPIYFIGRTEAETQRLIKQSALYGRATRRLFEDAGIGAGMRVLDVGTGAGDVALLVAELVGPTGSVVSVDMNPTILKTARARAAAAGLTTITFVEGDARTAQLGDDFDALVGRLVLMYVADPADTLRLLVRLVRPGGVVAFQECDWSMLGVYANSALCGPWRRERLNWLLEAIGRSGTHLSSGFGLHQLFEAAGLEAADMWLYAPLGGPADWAGYEYHADGFRSSAPLIEKYGITRAGEVDVERFASDMRAEVEATGLPAMLTPHVCAWARKPPTA